MTTVSKILNLQEAQKLAEKVSSEMDTLFNDIVELSTARTLEAANSASLVDQVATSSVVLRAKAADYTALATLLANTREALHQAYSNSRDIRATVRAQVNQSVIEMCDVLLAAAPDESRVSVQTARTLSNARALAKGAAITAIGEIDAITYSELRAELVRENKVLFNGALSLGPARIEVQIPAHFAHYLEETSHDHA